jgi:hypothetical protein
MVKSRPVTLQDLYIAAFLILYKLEPKLEMKNGRVFFIFEGSEQVYRLMNEFNSDVEIPVSSYVAAIKSLRARMFGVKSQDIVETERRKGFLGNEGEK